MSRRQDPVTKGPQEVQIPLDRVAAFVRQLSHDVRNSLGSMDLQAAYIGELVGDGEPAAELKKLRVMISGAAKMLQALSGRLRAAQPNPLTLTAAIFVEDFRDRLGRLFPEEASRLEWRTELGNELIAVDLELMFSALAEFCRNAFYFHEGKQPIKAHAFIENGSFVVEVHERRATLDSPPETWGVVPFTTTRRGAFGLGLFQARQILSGHRGALEFTHDVANALLTTRVTLPLAGAPENE